MLFRFFLTVYWGICVFSFLQVDMLLIRAGVPFFIFLELLFFFFFDYLEICLVLQIVYVIVCCIF